MKKITNIFRGALMMLLVTTVLSSCSSNITVQKRHHTKGYHVELTKKQKSDKDQAENQQTESAAVSQTVETASAIETVAEVELPAMNIEVQKVATVEEEAVVTEKRLTKKELKAEVKEMKKLITAEDIKQIKATTATPEPENTEETEGGNRNQIVAAVLAFLAGMLGIHRMYLGYWGLGFLQFFMLILGIILFPILYALWIWVLVDFVRILLGDLEPKNGNY